jgi:hypothetical protein
VIACACAGARGGGPSTSGFGVLYPDQPAAGFTAKSGKRFYVRPVARCMYDDGRDARWAMTGARVTTGALPDGVTLEDGAITGTPAKPGTYTARVTFAGNTCAGKPQPDQQLDVTIVVR